MLYYFNDCASRFLTLARLLDSTCFYIGGVNFRRKANLSILPLAFLGNSAVKTIFEGILNLAILLESQ